MVTSQENAPTSQRKSPIEAKLDDYLAERKVLTDRIAAAKQYRDEAVRQADEAFQKETAEPQRELDELDEKFTSYLSTHRYAIIRRLSKTINRPDGVVKFIRRAKSLDLPANVSAVITFILGRHGGGRYITWTPSLNKDAVTQASEKFQRLLRPFGVWVGKHDFITVQSPSESKPKTLQRRRLRESASKSDPR